MKKRCDGRKKAGILKSGAGTNSQSKGGSKSSGAGQSSTNSTTKGRSNNESRSLEKKNKGKNENTKAPSASARPPAPPKVAAVVQASSSSSVSSAVKASPISGTDILRFDTFPSDLSKIVTDEIISNWNNRVLARQKFRERSAADLYEEFEKMIKTKQLDSTLKKCTAFVKKMKLFPECFKTSIETDLNSLNLTKYISEIALVIVELKLKVNDMPPILSICQEIHKRYPTFAEHLTENFEKVLPSKTTKLVSSDVSKTTTDLRVFVELILGGILPLPKGCNILINCIQSMMHVESGGIALVVLLVSLLQGLSDELTGDIPKSVFEKLQENVCVSQLKRCNALPDSTKGKIKGLLKHYFADLKKTVVQGNDKVLGEEKYNRKLRETKGEVPPDRQQSHDKLVASFKTYYDCVSKLADLLNLSMPKLRQLPSDPEDEFEKALLMNEDGEILTEVPGIVLFEDEETRKFYQDLPDLKEHMSNQKRTTDNSDSNPKEGSTQSDDNDDDDDDSADESSSSSFFMSEEELDLEDVSGYGSNYDKDTEFLEDSKSEGSSEDLDDESLPSDGKDDKTEDLLNEDFSANPCKPNVQKYLSSLSNCANKSMIDKAAYNFVDNFKSKHSKAELVSHLVSVPRQRMDLVHLYARLIASLSRVYPQIGKSVSDKLLKDFRYHVLKKDQRKLETKLKVTRFIAELTNFSILSKDQVFNCFKLLLRKRNFVHHQIDMACSLIESCGGFLYRSVDSHRRMKLCLEEILRRKSSQYLEPRYVYMVDSAYTQVCPPAEKSIQRKRKSPQQVFMEKVLCYDLSKQTLEMAVKVLKIIDWKNKEINNMVVTTLSSTWKYSYAQLDILAALLASLKQFRPSVTQAVIENISEQIHIGCENECEDINNLRTSTCQLFAHLYNYKNVSTTTLLNVWYYLINYGVSYNINEVSRMDPPDNLSRVRLICHMLKIAGEYLSSERSNKRLEFFLKYFQRYYLFKRNHPIWQSVRFPHNIQEFYEDSMKRIKKGWKFVQTVEEAEKEIDELDIKLRNKVKSDVLKDVIQNKSSVRIPVSAAVKDKLQITNKLQKLQQHSTTYAKMAASSQVSSNNTLTEHGAAAQVSTDQLKKTEKRFLNKAPYLLSTVEEDDFEEAYVAICAESVSQSDNSRTPRLVPVEVPFTKMQAPTSSGPPALSNPGVKVTVLTKQNNKPRTKTLQVSPDEEFLRNIKLREQAEISERQEVKSRTMELARLQLEEEQKQKRKELPSIQDLLQKLLVSGSSKSNSTKDSTK